MSLVSPSQPPPPIERETEAQREEVTGLRSLSKWAFQLNWDRKMQEHRQGQHTPGDKGLLRALAYLSPHLPHCSNLEPAFPRH